MNASDLETLTALVKSHQYIGANDVIELLIDSYQLGQQHATDSAVAVCRAYHREDIAMVVREYLLAGKGPEGL